MSSYVEDIEAQNEELRERLSLIEEKYEMISVGGCYITTLYSDKTRDYSSIDIKKEFEIPSVLINSFYKRPIYFTSQTLDMAVLYILLNKNFGSYIFKNRLWAIECNYFGSLEKIKKTYLFRGNIFVSSDFKKIHVESWQKDKSNILEKRVRELLDYGEYEVDDYGVAKLK